MKGLKEFYFDRTIFFLIGLLLFFDRTICKSMDLIFITLLPRKNRSKEVCNFHPTSSIASVYNYY